MKKVFERLLRRILCQKLGKHNGNGSTQVYDGLVSTSKCSRCKQTVYRQKNGTWLTNQW